jgi:hypothetical protein
MMPLTPLFVPLFPPFLWIGLAIGLSHLFREPFSPKTRTWAGGYIPPEAPPPAPRPRKARKAKRTGNVIDLASRRERA